MKTPLPSLSAIRVFEATARHLNFTQAADELGMSQAAVSYQIKVLEEKLGTPLFLRSARKVALTDEGQRLAPPTIAAFEQLRVAFADTGPDRKSVLEISTTTTFAVNWLAGRLGAFQMAHPALAVRVRTEERSVNFARDPVDVAIRYGDGDWPGLKAHCIMPARFSPTLSPDLARQLGDPPEAGALLALPLFDRADPYWRIWFHDAGLPFAAQSQQGETRLGSQSEAAHAAISGHGVAILTPEFFRYELETGRLVQPFDQISQDGMGHWLVYPEARRNVASIRAFRQWILSEAGSGRA